MYGFHTDASISFKRSILTFQIKYLTLYNKIFQDMGDNGSPRLLAFCYSRTFHHYSSHYVPYHQFILSNSLGSFLLMIPLRLMSC